MSRTLEALKKLAVKCTGAANVAAVPGDTVDEVIEYIQANFTIASANGLVLTDSEGATYDIVVSTTGSLSASPRVKVATPTFTPTTGTTFADTQEVTIACATAGATIYYTIDGSTPTKESSVYSEAITVSATTTIKAFADKASCTDSNVATATYTKQ